MTVALIKPVSRAESTADGGPDQAAWALYRAGIPVPYREIRRRPSGPGVGPAPTAGTRTGLVDDPAITTPHVHGLDLVGSGVTVPVLGGNSVEYANLDHAASTPALRVVHQTVDALLLRYASVHRGAGWHSTVCTDLYEGARTPVREFVGGRFDDAVIFTRHTTDAFNLLAHCLPPRTTVVVFETEHHAALLPWPRSAPSDCRHRPHRARQSPRPTVRCGSAQPGQGSSS